MWHFFVVASSLLYLLSVTGCVSSGNPAVVDQERIAQIQLNVSTKEDVQRILGQPNYMSKQSGGYYPMAGLSSSPSLTTVEIWSYSHLNVAVNAATFIPVVGLFAGGATSNMNTFTVAFDDKGIVRHISSSQSQGRSGSGAGSSQPTKPVNDCLSIGC